MNDSKEHILLISLNLFSQKGFKEVTMKEIVDKTGLSKGAFYHYFSSKEQVFSEVISHFFTGVMTEDYNQFSQTSLKKFYHDILNKTEKNKAATSKLTKEDVNSNYYYLIFDAMRMLPNFKQKHHEQQKEELKAWKNIVAKAKLNGEIATPMTDEQVAKLFIFIGDGVNINLVINGGAKHALKPLWDNLYNSIKA